jgi:molybdate transport system substrate-binding protein
MLARIFAVLLATASFAAHATDLTVSAAASLSVALREVTAIFEADQPGMKVDLNFGASGALLQQIVKGAPVDVFLSADEETMNEAQAQGLIDASARRNFVSNVLVVVVPKASTRAPTMLSDLAQPQYARIAIGVPASVPAGRYAKASLHDAGLWPAIEPKMIGAQTVRQALDYVARGEVDAGFVYATDAALLPTRVSVAFSVPTKPPILYPAAPLAQSANASLANRFVAYLLEPRAQAIFARNGFGKP